MRGIKELERVQAHKSLRHWLAYGEKFPEGVHDKEREVIKRATNKAGWVSDLVFDLLEKDSSILEHPMLIRAGCIARERQ